MREFITADQDDQSLQGQLRADESLMSGGGVIVGGHDIRFLVAVCDEDFMSKDQKLRHRRCCRKSSQRNTIHG
jgi:hypothetical protein